MMPGKPLFRCVCSAVAKVVLASLVLTCGSASLPSPAYDPTTGNVLYFPFNNDYAPASVVRDHGPYGLDAVPDDPDMTVARYGLGREFDAGSNDPDVVLVPDSAKLFLGNTLTMEAWIAPYEMQDQAILSDFDADDLPNVEYSFELTAAGGLAFYSNAGCIAANEIVTTSSITIATAGFTHVAVTWDGTRVRFYVNGTLAETVPFAHEPCEFETFRSWRVGLRNDGDHPFAGIIDELKVSDYAKSEAEIQQSMRHDSATAGAICGDRIIEDSEQCDRNNACCDTSQCQFTANGTACERGSCLDGVCQIDGGRVDEGLVALYRFDEGEGDTVQAIVGGEDLDLTITDSDRVTWEANALTIDDATIIESTGSAAKIVDECKRKREITVEAWVRPDNETQDGPARIVTVSMNTSERSFTLGQSEQAYVFRVRSEASNRNGQPVVMTPPGDVHTALTHVVATRSADGERRIYVNGVLRAGNRVEGNFDDWKSSWRLALGNEFGSSDRAWLGTFHLVAVYCRALSGAEVAQNFAARAD